MKAYVTSIGEKTTEICCDQLTKFGFDVVLLDQKETWLHKYMRFINEANEDCLRIDADIIPNKNIANIMKEDMGIHLFASYCLYDLYRNNMYIGSPVCYTKEGLDLIRPKLDTLHQHQPERHALRMKETNPWKYQSPMVVGMHGFFQNPQEIKRAKQNKIDRKQIDQFDFALVNKLMEL